MITSNLFAIWKDHERCMGRRVTYAEVSEATGLSTTTLQRWMNGSARRFDADTMQALAGFFGRNPKDLLVETTIVEEE